MKDGRRREGEVIEMLKHLKKISSIFTPIFVIIYRYAGMFRDLLKVLLFLRPLMSVGWSVGLSVIISRKNGKLQFHAPSGAHVSTLTFLSVLRSNSLFLISADLSSCLMYLGFLNKC